MKLSLLLIGCVPLFFVGCASQSLTQKLDLEDLFEQTCRFGQNIRSVDGRAWLKVDSEEAKGQFPATIHVESKGVLLMEVSNLLGGTEAIVSLRDERYEIKTTQRNQVYRGKGSWAGLPLAWGVDLFLGRIPCPPLKERQGAQLSRTPEGGLQVKLPTEKFVYEYREWGAVPWPKRLLWERKGRNARKVVVEFEKPDRKTNLAKRWRVSSREGEVKMRWRRRKVTR